mgnify:CR=1 FL=1
MSGVAGADRIRKEDIKPTSEWFEEMILKGFDSYSGQFNFTGSYVVGKKESYGDIDIVILCDNKDKKELKKEFIVYLETNFNDDIIQRFTNPNYIGKRYNNSGELVSLRIPQCIEGIFDNKSVQMDVIFATTEEEFHYKTSFLNLPAEIQGLYLGIIKTLFLEVPENMLLQKCNINQVTLEAPKHGGIMEVDFNLSPKELQIRQIERTDDFKTLNTKVLWSTRDWNIVEDLLEILNAKNKTFMELLEVITNFKNERSINRVKGLFASMVTVKSGEVGTEKGKWKELCLDNVTRL